MNTVSYHRNWIASASVPSETLAPLGKGRQTASSSLKALQGAPSNTLQVAPYLSQLFGETSNITEAQGYLAIVGWGFNVMSESSKRPELRAFFNSRKDELLDATSPTNYESIANTILREAVKKGLITLHQAEHTKGNAFKASQFDRRLSSLSSSTNLSRESAIAKLAANINNFLTGKWDQEFLPLN